jgi:hypothetical protein
MQDMADDFEPTVDAPEAEAEQPEPVEDEVELEVTIEGETPAPSEEDDDAEPPAEAPKWVKATRAHNKELRRQVKELQEKLSPSIQVKAPEPGPEPTWEAVDYDPDRMKSELEAWVNRKTAYEKELSSAKEKANQEHAEWLERVADFDRKGAKYTGFQAAKATVMQTMTPDQQSMILDAAINPSLVVAALGKSPAKAKELASIKNPVKFTAEIARLELKMSATPRAPQTTPEKVITGASRSPATASANLEKLRAQAEETGDYNAYFTAKRAMK